MPFGIAGMLLALRFVADGQMTEPPRFDLPGFLLCGAGLALLQFALENVGCPMVPPYGVVLMFAVGAIWSLRIARLAHQGPGARSAAV